MAELALGLFNLALVVFLVLKAAQGLRALHRRWAFRRVRAFASAHGWQADRERAPDELGYTEGPYLRGTHRGHDFVFCRIRTGAGRNAARGGQTATGSSTYVELSPFVVLGDATAAGREPVRERGVLRPAGGPSVTWARGDGYLTATVDAPRVLGRPWFPRRRLPALLDQLVPLRAEHPAPSGAPGTTHPR